MGILKAHLAIARDVAIFRRTLVIAGAENTGQRLGIADRQRVAAMSI